MNKLSVSTVFFFGNILLFTGLFFVTLRQFQKNGTALTFQNQNPKCSINIDKVNKLVLKKGNTNKRIPQSNA
jgi:hypothetical protein